MWGDQGWNNAMSASLYSAAMSGAQAQHLQGMADRATAAIAKENDSRVAQAREQRRMQHEQEMKRMETEALLARLESARQPSGPAPLAAFRGGAIY